MFTGVILRLYWDNGEENGNYYNGLYVHRKRSQQPQHRSIKEQENCACKARRSGMTAQSHQLQQRRPNLYSQGHGDFVNGLMMGIIVVNMWLMGLLTYLLSPHDPPNSSERQ